MQADTLASVPATPSREDDVILLVACCGGLAIVVSDALTNPHVFTDPMFDFATAALAITLPFVIKYRLQRGEWP